MSGILETPRNQVLVGDATAQLGRLESGSVDMVLTSPPYFRLRNYDVDGQLGLEEHVDDWVGGLRPVVAELSRVLTPTGSLWLNLGDTYATHARQGADRKSLLGGPERIALSLIADGWRLRNKIVWQKANAMPTSTRDRLRCSWEVIYVFVKQDRYFFDLDAIRTPHRSRRRHPPTPEPPGPRAVARTEQRPPQWPGESEGGRAGWPRSGEKPRRRLDHRLQQLPRHASRDLSAQVGRAGRTGRLS